MAEQLSISQASYSRIENRPQFASVEQLLRLSNILEISPTFLLLGNSAENQLLSRLSAVETKLEELIKKLNILLSEL